ncbi:hypothetical protein [Bacillus xiapuensis]|uniref:hypothetical protein n=1 Tax=Bacillus xiapuensis TaxID=2014075 RepID=UPI000C235872|nr:hypothetical protein [Bacillus xiapuensis]
MKALIKYQILSFFYSLQWIAPLALYVCWLFSQYYYQGMPIQDHFSISSLFLFPFIVWVSMKLGSQETESEKLILLSYSPRKTAFFIGKIIVLWFIGAGFMVFSIAVPFILGGFSEPLSLHHILTFLYRHLAFIGFGIWIGGLFSITRLAGKKYSWLAAALFTSSAIVGEKLFEVLPWYLKGLAFVLPPVSAVEEGVQESWRVLLYIMMSHLLLFVLFQKKERSGE